MGAGVGLAALKKSLQQFFHLLVVEGLVGFDAAVAGHGLHDQLPEGFLG